MKKFHKILCCAVMMTVFIPLAVLSSDKEPSAKEAIFVLLNDKGEKIRYSSIMTITDLHSELRLDPGITNCELIDGLAVVQQTDQGVTIRRKEGYQGWIVVEVIQEVVLPFQVHLTYQLNGSEVNWKDISGKSGTVKVSVWFQSTNPSPEDRLPFTIQITVPLNTKKIQLLNPGKADVLTIGNKTNLVYADLMLDSLNWEWEAYSDNWTMDSWEMTLLPKYPNLDLESYLSMVDSPIQALEKMNDGYAQIREGVQEINKNQTVLLDGYDQVNDGWNQWVSGFHELIDNLPALIQAFEEYRSGLNDMQSGLKEQQTAIDQELEKWKSLQSKLNQAQTGFSLFSSKLTMLKANHDRLIEDVSSISNEFTKQTELADQVLRTTEKDSPAYQLAVSVRDTRVLFEDIHSMMLDESKDILFLQSFWDTFQTTFQDQYLPMIEEASDQINTFVTGMNTLITGLQDFDKGLLEGQQGVMQMQTGSKTLIENAKVLLSSKILLQNNADKLQKGSRDIHDNLLLIERTGMQRLINELKKAQSDFKDIIRKKNQAETLFKNADSPFYIVKINFPDQTFTIFERFQEKLRSHYNK
ncbi:hypothetical protein LLG10_01225 [bacterium]|nr:hypothetical protein [bacterium]